MTNTELQKQLEELEQSFQKFSQVCKLVDSPITTHSTIQRFETAFKACWDTLSKTLELRGLVPDSKPETIQMAFDMKLIQATNIWRDMLHDVEQKITGSGASTDEYYLRIKKVYYAEINDTVVTLKEKSALQA